MPKLVEETTGDGVKEHWRRFANGVLNGHANGRFRLFWIYVFAMTLYNTRLVDKHRYDVDALTTYL